MSNTLYTRRGRSGYRAADAIRATITYVDPCRPSWGPMRAEEVCVALFSALTESQQDRVLRSLGWEPQASAVTPLPPPAPTPGELEVESWRVAPDCTRRASWGGCHCKTPGQRAVCMYRGKP